MKTVLIIDDNPVITSIYRGKLAAEGLQTEIARDGEQGLEMVDRCRPDAVLLDLMLPKVNGMDVLKRIRAREEWKALPVIVFSNSYSTDVMQQAWGFGATDVLHKSSTTPRSVVLALVRAIATRSESAPPVATSEKSEKSEKSDGIAIVDAEQRLLHLLDRLVAGKIETADSELLRVASTGACADHPAAAARLYAALEVLVGMTREMSIGPERDAVQDSIRSLSRVARNTATRQHAVC
jgi:DNA-binding response OmpR family regulator